MTPPRYQAITRDDLVLLTSDDGGALIRLIAGDIAGFTGPGVTHTPITYAHTTLAPGAQLSVPWSPAFSAMAYVLTGRGTVGRRKPPRAGWPARRVRPGRPCRCGAADRQAEPLDVLLLGGLPDPRTHRPLRALRDEHPRGDRPGRRGLPGRQARHRPRRSARAPQSSRDAALDATDFFVGEQERSSSIMTTSAGVILLVGRVLFAVFFANSAYGHIKRHGMMVSYAKQNGVPVPIVAGWPAGAWLGAAALSVAAGIWADLGALMIAAFLIPTSGLLHPFWKFEDPAQRQTHQQGFLRNVTVSRRGTRAVRRVRFDRSQPPLRHHRLVNSPVLTRRTRQRRRIESLTQHASWSEGNHDVLTEAMARSQTRPAGASGAESRRHRRDP